MTLNWQSLPMLFACVIRCCDLGGIWCLGSLLNAPNNSSCKHCKVTAEQKSMLRVFIAFGWNICMEEKREFSILVAEISRWRNVLLHLERSRVTPSFFIFDILWLAEKKRYFSYKILIFRRAWHIVKVVPIYILKALIYMTIWIWKIKGVV